MNLQVDLRIATAAVCLLILTVVALATTVLLRLAAIGEQSPVSPAMMQSALAAAAPAQDMWPNPSDARTLPVRPWSQPVVRSEFDGPLVPPAAAQAARTWGAAFASVRPVGEASRSDTERVLRDSIDALAVRVGQLQAELVRLEAVGQRVAGMAGVDLSEVGRDSGGQGGPAPAASSELSVSELSDMLSAVETGADRQAHSLSVVEALLLEKTVRDKLLPTGIPLERGFVGSGFGRRIDPFTGRGVVHEGIDFNAPRGTPILAAAAGVIVFAGRHPSYGKYVDIDHGDGLVTRYAHASRLYVKQGDIVRQGQRIAAVGSTGRSTGPHLHFEVLLDGRAQNPLKYLADGFELKRGFKLAAD